MEHAGPDFAIFVRHGFVEVGERIGRSRRPKFLDAASLGVKLDERAVAAAEPGVVIRSEAAALGRGHVIAGIGVDHLAGGNVETLSGVAPGGKAATGPIFLIGGDERIVAEAELERPFLDDLAGFGIDLADFAVAAIPHEAIVGHGEVAEAGSVERHGRVDLDLGDVAGGGIEAVEIVSPIFGEPNDALLVDVAGRGCRAWLPALAAWRIP